jgi:Protein of unknown function (DUF3618)
MENEDPEVIRRQMQRTRSDLTEKLEAIEDKVSSTVKGTTEAVSETVDHVKEAVHDTVEGVKHAFDLKAHFQNHPWLMLGGTVGLSFLATKLLTGRRSHEEQFEPPAHSYTSAGAYDRSTRSEPTPMPASAPSAAKQEQGPSWMESLMQKLAPSAHKIKEMGIGMTMGLVDQLLTSALPERLREGAHEILDSITTSLGGKRAEHWDAAGPNGAHHSEFQSGSPQQYRVGSSSGQGARDIVS